MTLPIYSQARKERFADTVCEYIDEEQFADVFLQDLKDLLRSEDKYYQGKADQCKALIDKLGI